MPGFVHFRAFNTFRTGEYLQSVFCRLVLRFVPVHSIFTAFQPLQSGNHRMDSIPQPPNHLHGHYTLSCFLRHISSYIQIQTIPFPKKEIRCYRRRQLCRFIRSQRWPHPLSTAAFFSMLPPFTHMFFYISRTSSPYLAVTSKRLPDPGRHSTACAHRTMCP